MLLMMRLAFTISFCLPVLLYAQEWPSWGGDPGGSKYSSLKEINRENVTRLRQAWIFHTGDVSDGKRWPTRSAFEATPLVVDGVMYVTTPFSRVIALDPETGKELWSFDPHLDRTESASLFINRGTAYWSDGSQKRIFLGTMDGGLFSLIAETGKPDPAFGTGGWVDLRKGVAEQYAWRRYGMTSPPAIYKNLVICGSLVPDAEPHGPPGDVRAFDARTGKLVWTFHTVARPGEFGHDTWGEGAWVKRGGTNVWAPISVDTERGIVFLPVTSPATDFYGGDRDGKGLFGDSLLALDAATGKRVWHFQTVHHDLWDYDLPAQPVLVKVVKDGKPLDAVAQVTKTGFTFVFDRATGKPVFPIEEVHVPASQVPEEKAWPTQPRPVLPPPFARQKMLYEELTTVTKASRAYCSKLLFGGATLGAMFTPIGPTPTVLFPGTNGGANWGGASFDPETHTLYVNSMDVGMLYHMVKTPPLSQAPYRAQGSGSTNSRFWDEDLNPCQQPPWGFLTAINLDSGNFRWRSVLGVVDKLIDQGFMRPTGAPNIGGSLVTAGGLIFIGATNDSRFRAFNKDNGAELWVTRLPASGHATPITFRGRTSGRQFVVIAAGGGNKYSQTFSDSLVAYALPAGESDAPPLVTYSRSVAREAAAKPVKEVAAGAEPFSHKRHAALKLQCVNCHAGAVTGERAGFPAASVCMSCHRTMATDKPEIKRLAALPATEKIVPNTPVYTLPGFVFFRHNRHLIECGECHGDIWGLDQIQPRLQMKMSACVDCHRTKGAVETCTSCHELSQ